MHSIDIGVNIWLFSRPREKEIDTAAVGVAVARAQVPEEGVAGQRRGVAVHAAALQDDEERAEPHDDVSGG